MKIAAFLATLLVRLLGVCFLFKSAAALLTLLGTVGEVPGGSPLAVVLVLEVALSAVTVLLAGRIVRLFTADAPFADE